MFLLQQVSNLLKVVEIEPQLLDSGLDAALHARKFDGAFVLGKRAVCQSFAFLDGLQELQTQLAPDEVGDAFGHTDVNAAKEGELMGALGVWGS